MSLFIPLKFWTSLQRPGAGPSSAASVGSIPLNSNRWCANAEAAGGVEAKNINKLGGGNTHLAKYCKRNIPAQPEAPLMKDQSLLMPQTQQFTKTDLNRQPPTPTNNSITFQLQDRVALVYMWGDRKPGYSSQKWWTREPKRQTEVCISSYKNIGNVGINHITTKKRCILCSIP